MSIFKRRIGPDPHEGNMATSAASGCPDIWELESGEFAVIGIRNTTRLKTALPATASCGHDEEIVVIPRNLLIKAKRDIPDV